MTDPGIAATELDTQPQQSHTDESPHRHATLKKKNSIKRSASKRSKADTLGSTTLNPTSNHDEPRNDPTRSPLYCPVPTNADPTIVLAARFQGAPLSFTFTNGSLAECNQGVHQLFQIGIINGRCSITESCQAEQFLECPIPRERRQ